MKYIKNMNIDFNDWDYYKKENIDYPQYVDKKIYKRFIEFLKNNDIYDEYFNKLNKIGDYYNTGLYQGENFFLDIEPYNWLYKAFSWAGDFDKWDELDIKWCDILDKIDK